MLGGERQARCAAAGIADQVEALEAGFACGAQDAGDLMVQRVAGGWRGSRVELEILRDHVGVVAERRDQGAIGKPGRHDATGEKDRFQRHLRASVLWCRALAGNTRGGTRTHTPVKAELFESSLSTVPAPGLVTGILGARR